MRIYLVPEKVILTEIYSSLCLLKLKSVTVLLDNIVINLNGKNLLSFLKIKFIFEVLLLLCVCVCVFFCFVFFCFLTKAFCHKF